MRKIISITLFSLFCFSAISTVNAEELNYYQQHMQELEQKKINKERARQEAIAQRNEQIRIQQEIQYRNQQIELQNQQIRNANRARQERLAGPSVDDQIKQEYLSKMQMCNSGSGSFGEALAKRAQCGRILNFV